MKVHTTNLFKFQKVIFGNFDHIRERKEKLKHSLTGHCENLLDQVGPRNAYENMQKQNDCCFHAEQKNEANSNELT